MTAQLRVLTANQIIKIWDFFMTKNNNPLCWPTMTVYAISMRKHATLHIRD